MSIHFALLPALKLWECRWTHPKISTWPATAAVQAAASPTCLGAHLSFSMTWSIHNFPHGTPISLLPSAWLTLTRPAHQLKLPVHLSIKMCASVVHHYQMWFCSHSLASVFFSCRQILALILVLLCRLITPNFYQFQTLTVVLW